MKSFKDPRRKCGMLSATTLISKLGSFIALFIKTAKIE